MHHDLNYASKLCMHDDRDDPEQDVNYSVNPEEVLLGTTYSSTAGVLPLTKFGTSDPNTAQGVPTTDDSE